MIVDILFVIFCTSPVVMTRSVYFDYSVTFTFAVKSNPIP